MSHNCPTASMLILPSRNFVSGCQITFNVGQLVIQAKYFWANILRMSLNYIVATRASMHGDACKKFSDMSNQISLFYL